MEIVVDENKKSRNERIGMVSGKENDRYKRMAVQNWK